MALTLNKTRAAYVVLTDIDNPLAAGSRIDILSAELMAGDYEGRSAQVESVQAKCATSANLGYFELYAVSAGHAAYLARRILQLCTHSMPEALVLLRQVKV